ncbi:hypothetical protein [Herbaspirillum huttiense]|uniref:DUF1515 domain-containing protein n=1 Tax=Herbaspirillum huttiense subsp. lycopersici TaxID=3074428 RepID=A0ABU2EFU9_9BURK|nr:hypothetical protein [Herbaspirillum huttiense]MDR9847001.1 hypothetical protein [Herbaspirillum huttiense SE1]
MSTTPALEQQIREMRSEHRADMRELRDTVKVIADAVTRLTVLEEKHSRTQTSVERQAQKLEKTEERMHVIELEHAKFISTAKGASAAAKVLWSAFGAGIVAVGGTLVKFALERAS